MARPSSYRKTVAVKICVAIATSTRGLKAICDDNERFPHPSTVYRWLSVSEEFREMYARAKQDQLQILADEILPIADMPLMGEFSKLSKVTADGKTITTEVRTGDLVERSKLQVDARKWLLAKLNPRKYGERIEVETGDLDPLHELIKAFKVEHAKDVKAAEVKAAQSTTEDVQP